MNKENLKLDKPELHMYNMRRCDKGVIARMCCFIDKWPKPYFGHVICKSVCTHTFKVTCRYCLLHLGFSICKLSAWVLQNCSSDIMFFVYLSVWSHFSVHWILVLQNLSKAVLMKAPKHNHGETTEVIILSIDWNCLGLSLPCQILPTHFLCCCF